MFTHGHPSLRSVAVVKKQQQQTKREQTVSKLFNQSIGHRVLGLLLGALVTIGMATYGADTPSSTTWYSGQRAFGQVVVEPAVDLATGLNCSITSITTYLDGTPLSFTVP